MVDDSAFLVDRINDGGNALTGARNQTVAVAAGLNLDGGHELDIRGANGFILDIQGTTNLNFDLGGTARMNLPGVARGNWRWRVLETEMSDDLCDNIASLVKGSNRGLSQHGNND